MHPADYLAFVVNQLVAELRPAEALRSLTTNPQLLGAHTEAAVRQLVARIVAPLSVCSGGVTDAEFAASGQSLPEIDTIIWAPSPLPALFVAGNFGLVPRSSAFGLLEIKRSIYSGVPKQLRERTDPGFVRRLVTDSPDEYLRALGVVCVKLESQRMTSLTSLLAEERVVVLFEEVNDHWKPRPRDIAILVNFLTSVRTRASAVLGTQFLNHSLLS